MQHGGESAENYIGLDIALFAGKNHLSLVACRWCEFKLDAHYQSDLHVRGVTFKTTKGHSSRSREAGGPLGKRSDNRRDVSVTIVSGMLTEGDIPSRLDAYSVYNW